MAFFDFTEMRLDSAFRKLCSKLYFKAEAQQIDRILESFANRYWDCNPSCLFGSAGMKRSTIYTNRKKN
jgi:Sec7-like guanine-nucleotide exchange factor